MTTVQTEQAEQSKPAEPKPVDSKLAGPKLGEPDSDSKPSDSQPVESKLAEAPPSESSAPLSTATIIAAMLAGTKNPSDLIFSPGRAPQVEVSGQLVQLKIPGVGMLKPEDTARIASDLIGRNTHALDKLKEQGSCDISYSLARLSRFRVNIFTQRGSCAIVMRVIPTSVPDFTQLNLPQQLAEAADLRNGIVLVTGPTGSGKSSTLAAIVNKINEEKAFHVITIEDPIEFLHAHKRATIHQRELHTDTPNFALALRAALRQAPKVILVGEMRDKETIEVALEAAETGHLVFSTLHTTDASKTIERIIGVFALGEQNAIRKRLAKSFRYIISQRLMPRKDGSRPRGRHRDSEIHAAHARVRRKGRKRRKIAARRHARRLRRRNAVLRRRNREKYPLRRDRHGNRTFLLHECRKPAPATGRLARRTVQYSLGHSGAAHSSQARNKGTNQSSGARRRPRNGNHPLAPLNAVILPALSHSKGLP